MSVEIFSKEDFEEALTTPKQREQGIAWKCQGLVDGEWCYTMRTGNDHVLIFIRSSVKQDNRSADTGDDSIRCWLVDNDLKPIGSKISKWTTRLPNWQQRLMEILRTLAKLAGKLEICPVCNKIQGMYKVKKEGPTKGRFFQNCRTPNCPGKDEQFAWIILNPCTN
jgi:hypothetical protein